MLPFFFLGHQPPSLPLCPLLTLRCALVQNVQGPPRYQHFTQRSLWVGGGSLFQYYHSVLDVPIPEVHPHGRLHYRPAATPLYLEVPCPCLLRKFHPIRNGLVAPPFPITLLPWSPLFHSVLGL